MENNHLAVLRQRPFPLVNSIEPGLGFRIGGETHAFSLAGTVGETWTFSEETTGLQLVLSLQVIDQTVVVSGILQNRGSAPVSGIEILEPLSLVFRNPAGEWRHVFANGGTTEAFYPPTAYRTQEWTRGNQALHLESHPEGRSSNLHLPFLISLASRTTDSEGFFCGMAWSGAWYMNLRKVDETCVCFSAGVKVHSLELEPGERLQLPEVHLGFFRGGAEAGTNALRRYLYEHVCPPYQGRPTLPRVSYDHWFGIGNSLNLDRMKAQAARAAQLGVEVFVVDAAWFPGNFPDGVGNWDQVDRTKFPDGLAPLADHVRGFGDTSVLSRMLGKLAFDGDIGSWSPSLTVRMGSWVTVFKNIRHLLVQDFYQLLPQPQTAEDWDAVQFVAYAGEAAVVFAFAGCRASEEALKLRGLQRGCAYVVTPMPGGASTVMSGDTLMDRGLPIALEQDQGGLWRIRAER